jgi:hypothetical protein
MALIEDLCEQHLQKAGIKYLRNRYLFVGKEIVCEIDFIISGAVIEIKTSYHSQHLKKLIAQLQRIKKYIPKDFIIYFFAMHSGDVDTIKKQLSAIDRVVVISDFNEIKCQNYPYFTDEPSVIRTFGAPDYKGTLPKELSTTQYCYNRAIAHLMDEELKKAHEIKFNIVDHEPHRCILLVRISRDHRLFDTFLEHVHTLHLGSGLPVRHIEGVTNYCQKCNQLNYFERITDNRCIKCSNGSLKRKRKEFKTEIQNKRQKLSQDQTYKEINKPLDVKSIITHFKAGLTSKEIRKIGKHKRSPLKKLIKHIHNTYDKVTMSLLKQFNIQEEDMVTLRHNKNLIIE